MEYTKKQQKIIDATIDIIILEGIDRVTTRRIAKELKITDPALYNHFDSKEAILVAVCDAALESYEAIWRQIDMIEGRGLERVRQIFMSWCKYHDVNSRLSFIQLNAGVIFRNFPEISEKFEAFTRHDMEIIVSLIREAQRINEVRDDVDPRDLAQIIFGTYLSVVTHWLGSVNEGPLYDQGKRTWAALSRLVNPFAVGIEKEIPATAEGLVLKF
jgi:TetR/AcrR family transcriptional regulator, fatty acid metabolism regulator protein